ncbi:hypothetical protein ALO87_200090 [Pseudomonas syringae pv. apii]|nr:hypothetical protein ALO87_200090 [Pseudomonas syringae pv. apii]
MEKKSKPVMRATKTLASATKIDVAKPHKAMATLSSKPLIFSLIPHTSHGLMTDTPTAS